MPICGDHGVRGKRDPPVNRIATATPVFTHLKPADAVTQLRWPMAAQPWQPPRSQRGEPPWQRPENPEAVLAGFGPRACTAQTWATAIAVRLTAEELRPGDEEQAEHVALAISQVFSTPVPDALPAVQVTSLGGLRAGIAGQLALLDDASLTDMGQSSADALGVPTMVLTEKLMAHLVREIVVRGSRGGLTGPLYRHPDSPRSAGLARSRRASAGEGGLVALDVDDLPQRMLDLHQVGCVGHNLINWLIGVGDLVQECVAAAPLDAFHGRV
jgi:hypothetical protein